MKICLFEGIGFYCVYYVEGERNRVLRCLVMMSNKEFC